jgi:hypothetical protein
MELSTRWMAIAGILGMCTAYVLWGGAVVVPAPPEEPVAPPAKAEPGAAATPKSAPSAPTALTLDPNPLDFGEVLIHQTKDATVAVKNTGSVPVSITHVKGTCACLKVEMAKMVIAPGTSEDLKVTFIAQPGKRPESYFVTLTTDEPGIPRAILPVRGKCKQVFIVEPQVLYFGNVPKNRAETKEAVITHADGKPFQIREIRASNPEFSFKWEPLPTGGYRILATTLSARAGAIAEGAAVLTDHPVILAVPLQLSVRITGDVISLTPVLAAAQQTDKTVGPFQTVIQRLTPGELKIDKVTEADGAAVDYTVERVDEKTCKLSVVFKEPFTRGVPVGKFLVHTNVEREPLDVPYRVERRGPQVISRPDLLRKKPGTL